MYVHTSAPFWAHVMDNSLIKPINWFLCHCTVPQQLYNIFNCHRWNRWCPSLTSQEVPGITTAWDQLSADIVVDCIHIVAPDCLCVCASGSQMQGIKKRLGGTKEANNQFRWKTREIRLIIMGCHVSCWRSRWVLRKCRIIRCFVLWRTRLTRRGRARLNYDHGCEGIVMHSFHILNSFNLWLVNDRIE